jgi:hypothetical protein
MPYHRGEYRDKWRIERLAASVRGKLDLDQLTPLNPWRLADAIPAHVFYPEDFGDGEFARRMRGVKWDALAFCCPGERTSIIVLNPAKAETRQTATLMEEFSHHLLGHRRLARSPGRILSLVVRFGGVSAILGRSGGYFAFIRNSPEPATADRAR